MKCCFTYIRNIFIHIYTHASGTLNFATDSTFDCTKSADANRLMVMNFDQNFPSHYSHHERWGLWWWWWGKDKETNWLSPFAARFVLWHNISKWGDLYLLYNVCCSLIISFISNCAYKKVDNPITGKCEVTIIVIIIPELWCIISVPSSCLPPV